MLDAMSHYGTRQGVWRSGEAGLASRANAPADTPLEEGGAPALASDAGRRLAAAAAARLDDRRGLCDALGVAPNRRAELRDCELILLAYARWGRACPRHLLGDFAFAVWDGNERTLFCARDAAGAQPLYYAETPAGFVFASAVESVLAASGVAHALDHAVVAESLTRTRWRSPERTFFTAIRKLPPGHAVKVKRGKALIERHWHPEEAPRLPPASSDAYAEELLRLFRQAVADRLPAAGEVGVHLSGGVDSSSVSVLAAQALRERGQPPPTAFTWLPRATAEARRKDREYQRIDAVCRQEGLPLCHEPLHPADVVTMLRRDGALPGVHVHWNEEAVQRAAQQRGVSVMLAGSGGDEGIAFDGRGHDEWLLLTGRWRRWLAECRASRRRPRRVLGQARAPLRHLADALRWRAFSQSAVRLGWLIHPDFARRARPSGPVPVLELRDVGMRRTQLRLLRFGHLCQRLEGWAASGAARGIDYRHPLLDRRLLEFALGLPPEQFRRGVWQRWLMRWALRNVLPANVAWNQDKSDPARREPVFDAYDHARPALRRELEAGAGRFDRAGYLDMPRLMQRLDAAQPLASQGVFHPLASLHNALQLLDF